MAAGSHGRAVMLDDDDETDMSLRPIRVSGYWLAYVERGKRKPMTAAEIYAEIRDQKPVRSAARNPRRVTKPTPSR